MSNKGYTHPGDIEVDGIYLIATSGEAVDISPIVREINIYHDMMEHYLQCDVVLVDALAVIDAFGGLTGYESLIVSFRNNDDESEFNTHAFMVHKVSNRNRINERAEAYLLSCISLEAYSNISTRISKAFGPSTVSDMIKAVFQTHFKTPEINTYYSALKDELKKTIDKKLDVDATIGSEQIIVPNLVVSDAIEFLNDQADSETVPYYLFYEDSQGFKYKNVNSLLEQEPIEKYTYMPSNLYIEERTAEDIFKIISFEVLRETDIIDDIKGGLFSSKTFSIDILNKTTSTEEYTYEKYQKRFNTLLNNPITPQAKVADTVFRSVTKTENKRYNRVLAKRESFEKSITGTIMNVTVPGNSEITVGKIIELSFPTANNIDGDQQLAEDVVTSGKFLITKVRHKFDGKTGGDFATVFECIR